GVASKVGDNISTDEILPAGARVLPFRSDIARLAEFTFSQVDEGYAARAHEAGTHVIVAGENYGQGSSREHAVIAPRYLGLRLVIAKSYARIHWQNLANFGILPLTFVEPNDYEQINQGDFIIIKRVKEAITNSHTLSAEIQKQNITVPLQHTLSSRQ